jgi:serine/threonine protein kinase
LNSTPELSKSRFFSVKDGTIVLADHAEGNARQSDNLPAGIIDQKYRLLDLLGEGGMGAVFRAHHLMLDKDVALKTFRSASLTEEVRLRFQREAQAIAKLSHKNVIQVFDFGLSENGVPYYTMEYLKGQSLDDRIRKNGPLTVPEAIELFIPICQGLSLAHSKGIIHRDLKPANIFIEDLPSASGTIKTVKIVDFGIASLTNQSLDGQKLTTVGIIFGSPLYMSPEQSTGEAVTERSDIYSVGCTLFEALTGKPPFRGANPLDTIMLHHNARVPTLKEASGGTEYPAALERQVAAMLAKSPGERPPSMEQVAADLSQLVPGREAVSSKAVTAGHKTTREAEPGEPDKSRQETGLHHPGGAGARPFRLAALLLAVGAMGLGGILCLRYKVLSPPPVVNTPSGPVDNATAAAHVDSKARTGEPSSQTSAPEGRREFTQAGKKFLEISFAPGLDLGCLVDSPNDKSPPHQIGKLILPTDKAPIFRPSKEFLQNPANFEKFALRDLKGLDLKDGLPNQKDSRMMRQIGRLTRLRTLDLTGSEINDHDLDELSKLTRLDWLSVNSTNITGAGLARLPRLKQLDWLRFSECIGAHELLIALKDSSKLRGLQMNEDLLGPEDFKAIGTLSDLDILKVNDSGMQVSDLASLTGLKKLRKLEAKDCKITSKAIEPLTAMAKNKLDFVRLDGSQLSKQDTQLIARAIPKAKLDENKHKNIMDTTDTEWQDFPKKYGY